MLKYVNVLQLYISLIHSVLGLKGGLKTMLFSKRKILMLFLTVLALVAMTATLFAFFTEFIFWIVILTGLFMSFRLKQSLEIFMYLSLIIVFVLPKLEGVLFKSGFLPSLVFVLSYIALCISGILFTVKFYRRIKYTFAKEKRYY